MKLIINLLVGFIVGVTVSIAMAVPAIEYLLDTMTIHKAVYNGKPVEILMLSSQKCYMIEAATWQDKLNTEPQTLRGLYNLHMTIPVSDFRHLCSNISTYNTAAMHPYNGTVIYNIQNGAMAIVTPGEPCGLVYDGFKHPNWRHMERDENLVAFCRRN